MPVFVALGVVLRASELVAITIAIGVVQINLSSLLLKEQFLPPLWNSQVTQEPL